MPNPTLLSINNYYYRRGGAEVVFLEQNRLFQEQGWEIVPFAMQHGKNMPSKWSSYFVDEIEFGESYSSWEKAVRAAKVIYSFEARRKLRRLIAEAKPQVAHAHNVYNHISPSIFGVLRDCGVPTVLTLHDLKIACPAYKMLTHDGICERCKGGKFLNVVRHRCVKNELAISTVVMLESALNRWLGSYENNVDRFVVPSRFYIDKFVEWGFPRERFTHVPNFCDIDAHHPHGAPGKVILFFGRLAPEKGLETLIRAAAKASVPLQIAGTGPDEAMLKRLAGECGGAVEFLGYRSGEDLHAAIRGARAVALPSEWYENAPMSVMESYALRRPVIGARIGGIPELIRENETGFCFESGDVDDLANAMRRMSELSDARIEEMGSVGRDWVVQDFTATRYTERLLALYRELGVAC